MNIILLVEEILHQFIKAMFVETSRYYIKEVGNSVNIVLLMEEILHQFIKAMFVETSRPLFSIVKTHRFCNGPSSRKSCTTLLIYDKAPNSILRGVREVIIHCTR